MSKGGVAKWQTVMESIKQANELQKKADTLVNQVMTEISNKVMNSLHVQFQVEKQLGDEKINNEVFIKGNPYWIFFFLYR
jgi:hypothetical protein